jgi:hypothetical protein
MLIFTVTLEPLESEIVFGDIPVAVEITLKISNSGLTLDILGELIEMLPAPPLASSLTKSPGYTIEESKSFLGLETLTSFADKGE